MALSAATFSDVASRHDKSDILLSNHAPEILECVLKGSLRGDNFSITDLAKRTIDKICVDVAIDDWISCWHASARHENWPRVFVSLDITISVFLIDFFAFFHAHIILYFSDCALMERIKLIFYRCRSITKTHSVQIFGNFIV